MLTGHAQEDNKSELAVFALERYRVSHFIRDASSPSVHQSKAKVIIWLVHVLVAGTAHLVTGLVELLPVSIVTFQIWMCTYCRPIKWKFQALIYI